MVRPGRTRGAVESSVQDLNGSGLILYGGLSRDSVIMPTKGHASRAGFWKTEELCMHSETYQEAKKEFWNCVFMSVFGIGIPLYLAFTEWRPIMQAELAKEQAARA